MRVLVLGGRGFIGRHAAAALAARGHRVLIGSRFARHGLQTRFERLLAPQDWSLPLAQVDAVVNAVGILRERAAQSYERVHCQAVAALAAACAHRGLRLVHVSALGLHAHARSRFIRSKLAGERALAASGADYCIVRPSLLDGEGGFGARWLRGLARLPLHFVPAQASGRIAALDVRDLGEAIACLCEAVRLPRAVELGGASAWTLAQYLQVLRAARGLPPAAQLPVPGALARLASHLCDLAHCSPFSFGHLELLQRDNVPAPNELARILGRPARRIEEGPSPGSGRRAAGGRAWWAGL